MVALDESYPMTISTDSTAGREKSHCIVIPAKAGIQQKQKNWIPAFAGMTASPF
jgi:hypothetical protein